MHGETVKFYGKNRLIPQTRDVILFNPYQILITQFPAYDCFYSNVTKKNYVTLLVTACNRQSWRSSLWPRA